MSLYYTGVGSRETPPDICAQMTTYANRLQHIGFTLRSGGATGADIAFEAGAGDRKQIFLPWSGFSAAPDTPKRYVNGTTYLELTPEIADRAALLASFIHPNWKAVLNSRSARFSVAAHARNCAQVLGPDLESPATFLVCWAPPKDGSVTGGTRTAYELSRHQHIPAYNLAVAADRLAFDALVVALEANISEALRQLSQRDLYPL